MLAGGDGSFGGNWDGTTAVRGGDFSMKTFICLEL